MENYTFLTAESVSPRHPDKLCDQISDAILDTYLAEDPDARVAVEVCGGHGEIFITGEVTSRAKPVDAVAIAHRLAGDEMKVRVHLVEQSPEIAAGVDTGGAGDQGIMIGYACSETPELLPREVVLARRLNQRIYADFPFDGKTQVTLKNTENGPEIQAIVASFQNASSSDLEKIVRAWLEEQKSADLLGDPELHLNPAGEWHLGGFSADTGLTGRKLIVDNYGPRIPIGGGAFSGKDPSKVDRSAAYMARRIAVDYLRARFSEAIPSESGSYGDKSHQVLVRLAYAIGYDKPLEQTVVIDGVAERIPDEKYDLTPRGIIRALDLRRPIYEPTARYGHFGEGFAWD